MSAACGAGSSTSRAAGLGVASVWGSTPSIDVASNTVFVGTGQNSTALTCTSP